VRQGFRDEAIRWIFTMGLNAPICDSGPVLCIPEVHGPHPRSHCQFLCAGISFVACRLRVVRTDTHLPTRHETLQSLKILFYANNSHLGRGIGGFGGDLRRSRGTVDE
jgi:hypothetical protein